jgi:hypothetical protein
MNIKQTIILLVMCIALLAIPIVWLTLQVSESITFLAPIIILVNLVIANIMVRKTSYKSYQQPYQQPYQHRSYYTVKRIQQTIAVGVATALLIGLITKLLIHPLWPEHFWYIYFGILFAIGVIIDNTLQRIL